MYKCESRTIKKAEYQRIDAFKLWWWGRLLRVQWTARRSNQSILKEINPEYSLEGLVLNLKLQYFGYLMWRANSLEKTVFGKDWRQEEKVISSEDEIIGWHHGLNGHKSEQTPGDGEEQGSLVWCSPWALKELDMTKWLNSNNLNSNLLEIICPFKTFSTGTSLVVHWLRIHLAMQGTKGHQFDPWSGKNPHAVEQPSPCTTASEAHESQSMLTTREATVMRSLCTVASE